MLKKPNEAEIKAMESASRVLVEIFKDAQSRGVKIEFKKVNQSSGKLRIVEEDPRAYGLNLASQVILTFGLANKEIGSSSHFNLCKKAENLAAIELGFLPKKEI